MSSFPLFPFSSFLDPGAVAHLSFACTGTISCIIGWFVLPEIARRREGELDEMFEAKVPPRKFRKYVTQVEINLREHAEKEGKNAEEVQA